MKKLHVPYNLDLKVLDLYQEWSNSIEDIYFPIPPSIFTSARELNFPPDYNDHVQTILNFCKQYQIRSALLVNGNRDDLTDQIFFQLTDYLNWIVPLGLDVIVVANPYLIHWIRNHWPKLSIRLSVLSLINTESEIASIMEYAPVEEICLPPEINRNLDMLKFLKQTYPKIKFSVLASALCRGGCPYYYWHQAASLSQVKYTQHTHNILTKELQYVSNHWTPSILQNPFILPSELNFYDQYIDGFKLEGRQYPTNSLKDMVAHYSLRVDPEKCFTIIKGSCVLPGPNFCLQDLDLNWLSYRKNCKMKCIHTCPFYNYCRLGQYTKDKEIEFPIQ